MLCRLLIGRGVVLGVRGIARPRAPAVQVDRRFPLCWRLLRRYGRCCGIVGNAQDSVSPSDVEVVLIGGSHLGMYGAIVVFRKK